MHDFPRQKLKDLIVLYGPSLYNDVALCRKVLQSGCAGYQLEVDSLITALEEGVVSELYQFSTGVLYLDLLTGITRRMQEKRGIPEEAGRWAVNSWALALGLIQVAVGENTFANSPTEQASYSGGGGTTPAWQGPASNSGSPSSPYQYPVPFVSQSYTPPPPPSYIQEAPFIAGAPSVPPAPPEKRRKPTGMLLIVSIVAILVIVSFVGIFATVGHELGRIAQNATPTATPSPTPVPYPLLSPSYGGKARNTTGKLNAEVSLTAIAQNQGNVTGNVNVGLPLVGSGPFQGSVSRSGAVHFVDTSNDGSNVTITFTGTVAADGSMSGTYSVSNNQGGAWSASPAKAPVVYPLLFSHYTGTFANNANGKSGVIILDLKMQDQQNFTGNFLIDGSSYPMTGTVGSDNSIQFSIAPDKTSSIKFTGSVNTDGSLSGTYTATTGGNGTWKELPL